MTTGRLLWDARQAIRRAICNRLGHRPTPIIVGFTSGPYEQRVPRYSKDLFCRRCRTTIAP